MQFHNRRRKPSLRDRTINNMDTIDAIDIIDESRVVEYIILSVKGNALGVTEGIDGIEGKYASVVE